MVIHQAQFLRALLKITHNPALIQRDLELGSDWTGYYIKSSGWGPCPCIGIRKAGSKRSLIGRDCGRVLCSRVVPIRRVEGSWLMSIITLPTRLFHMRDSRSFISHAPRKSGRNRTEMDRIESEPELEIQADLPMRESKEDGACPVCDTCIQLSLDSLSYHAV